jgi:hypothetical protein
MWSVNYVENLCKILLRDKLTALLQIEFCCKLKYQSCIVMECEIVVLMLDNVDGLRPGLCCALRGLE